MSPTSSQRALVTGASNGIGLELARILAREGYDLVLTARSGDTLEQVARELTSSYSIGVRVVTADLAAPSGPDLVMDAIATAGLPIDVLVNNAGFGIHGPFATTPLDTELRMIDLNVRALVALTKRCLPGMIERRRGRVLNVGSLAGFLPGPNLSVYYATKAFVLSFSEAIAEELHGTGVTVTALCPGPTDTAFQRVAGMERSRLFKGPVMTAIAVAETGYRGLIAGRRVVIPGASNRVVPLLLRLAPRRLVTMISRRAHESE